MCDLNSSLDTTKKKWWHEENRHIKTCWEKDLKYEKEYEIHRGQSEKA